MNTQFQRLMTGLLLLGADLQSLPFAQAGALAPPLLPGASYVDVTQAPYHANAFAVFSYGGRNTVLKGTDLPTYLRYEGYDPFADRDENRYLNNVPFRVMGLLRVGK